MIMITFCGFRMLNGQPMEYTRTGTPIYNLDGTLRHRSSESGSASRSETLSSRVNDSRVSRSLSSGSQADIEDNDAFSSRASTFSRSASASKNAEQLPKAQLELTKDPQYQHLLQQITKLQQSFSFRQLVESGYERVMQPGLTQEQQHEHLLAHITELQESLVDFSVKSGRSLLDRLIPFDVRAKLSPPIQPTPLSPSRRNTV